jgi:hypothetical protein
MVRSSYSLTAPGSTFGKTVYKSLLPLLIEQMTYSKLLGSMSLSPVSVVLNGIDPDKACELLLEKRLSFDKYYPKHTKCFYFLNAAEGLEINGVLILSRYPRNLRSFEFGSLSISLSRVLDFLSNSILE